MADARWPTFAIIHRLRFYGADVGWGGATLGVERIGSGERPGCLVAWVGGGAPDANARARRIADERAPAFRCGRDGAERVKA